jgi:hypothetical protein
MRAGPTIATVAVVLGASAHASASPSAKLVYVRGTGTESCPAEADLRKAVAVRLGYDPFFPSAQKTVVAEVSRATDGYRGRVRIVSDDGNVRGERELATKGDDCGELTKAIALAVSIALDDLDLPGPKDPVAAAPAEPSPAHEEEPPPPPPSPPPTRDAAPPPVAAQPRAEIGGSIGPTVAIGTAPDVAPGASLGAFLRWPRIALRIDGRAELPADRRSTSTTGTVSTNIAVATAAVCLRLGLPFACAGGGPGIVWSRTEGITKPATDRALLVVGLLRLGLTVPLGERFFLEPFVDLGVNLVPYRVEIDGQIAHEASPVWGLLGIHVGGKIL